MFVPAGAMSSPPGINHSLQQETNASLHTPGPGTLMLIQTLLPIYKNNVIIIFIIKTNVIKKINVIPNN